MPLQLYAEAAYPSSPESGKVRGMGKYCKGLLRRASNDTLSMLGYRDWRRLWLGPVQFFIALGFIRLISGEAQLSDEWKWGLAIFGALAASYIPLFLYNFIRAPDRINAEKDRELNQLKAQNNRRFSMSLIGKRRDNERVNVSLQAANNTKRTIKNTFVSVFEIIPISEIDEVSPHSDAQTIVGIPLRVSGPIDNHSPETGREDLHPDQPITFDVGFFNARPGGQGFGLIQDRRVNDAQGVVWYTHRSGRVIRPGDYRVTLVVRGEDAEPSYLTFDVVSTDETVEVIERDGTR